MATKIRVGEKILNENDRLAEKIRQKLAKRGIFAINVMASPGAGKTSLVVETIRGLKKKYRVAVVDGDVSDIDVQRLKRERVPVVLANTGGACHLDAVMMKKAVEKLDLDKIEVLIVENVGNLICPANFALGTDVNVVVASVPEGDDKPHKYPGMFVGADVVIVNKMDYAQMEGFDMSFFDQGVRAVNAGVEVIAVSCKTGEGLRDWLAWLKRRITSETRY